MLYDGSCNLKLKLGLSLHVGTVAGTKPCFPRPSEVRGKWIREEGALADKKAFFVHTISIISQLQ